MLILKNISKSFSGIRALRSVNLQIEPARTTVLIGPSGCGKSTLLRLIIGLIDPDEGMIEFEGQQITGQSIQNLRRRMGYVIQEGGLFPHLSASDNITLMARHLRLNAAEISRQLKRLCGLTQFPESGLDRFPAQLSGGQRQRVSLMRALMLDPELLLMDEPLGALDPMIRAELQNDLKQIFKDLDKTVLLVTHDLAEAGYLADTIALMRDGGIVQQGTLKDIVHNPAGQFVSRFINAQRSPLEDI